MAPLPPEHTDPITQVEAEVDPGQPEGQSLPPASANAMEEYYQLQQNLLLTTLAFTGVIFVSAWLAYSLPIALNYLIGACGGVVYLRMLAKSVANIGRGSSRLGSGRLALVVGLVLVATQWQQLQVVPVFLGFLTYKGALIAYTLWTAVLPDSPLGSSQSPGSP
ncbi:ATP synthase subunit I [Nodosilinea sp. E11]|uniref:ATP synthase subunit I n=1 Tax=Nodosilinea sp. E11 TaxID=3037479 RepID=UPI0029348CA0|nr:ATP synthase subunit I [Nodosilinea sp. E11]WOD38414.1 ATP synthase subunit I [Nodosilinea sp. E11]